MDQTFMKEKKILATCFINVTADGFVNACELIV